MQENSAASTQDLEEYILRWNDHGVSFFKLAENLLQQELLTDVTIWCGDQVFDAHRLVLCACSPLFKDMLTRQPPSPRRPDLQPVVFLKDVSPVHFERLLQFMYCGKVQVPNNELEDLLATATSLSVHGLAQPPPTGVTNPPTPPVLEPPLTTPKPAACPPKKRRLSRDNNHIIHSSSGKNEFNHFSSLVKKSPLSTLDSNQLFKTSMHVTNSASSHSHSPPPLRNLHHNPIINSITRGSAIKEEDEAVSPPPQAEMVPLVNEQKPPTITESTLNLSTNATPPSSATSRSPAPRSPPPPPTRISETQRILPPSEPRKTGTCYFCKKSFMKNKQLMNHVCPKKPRGGSSASSGGNTASATPTGAAAAGVTMLSTKSPT